jgi:hypothetical protein
MYSLFNPASNISQGTLKPASWIYVNNGLKHNLADVIKFYRKNPMAVKSSHFLVKLLQSITIPQSQNLERYYSNVDAISLKLSMTFGMTSSIYRGHSFNGIFYGPGNIEFLIATDESFDLFEENNNWENIQAVKVLRHPRSDLGLNILDGSDISYEKGIAVISINIPLLAVQYRAFRLAEIAATTDDDGEQVESQRTIMQFIHMYVLPNMLFSHLDYAIFNRIFNLELNRPLGEIPKNHSFYLPDYSSKMTKVHNEILDYIRNTNSSFYGMLQTIPVVVKKNVEEVMMLPDIAITRQVLWVLVIARLPELLFLCKLTKESTGNKNQSEINRIIRYFLNYKYDNIFRQMLTSDTLEDVLDDIEDIKSYT